MDRYLVRKDVFNEILEKGYGKRDLSKLQKDIITDKNGHRKTVYHKRQEVEENTNGKKTDEPDEKKTAKPKFEVGSTVSLDGVKGLFHVTKIDDDGSYHVEDTSGTKGYHVSENHIEGKSKVGVQNMEMTSGTKKISDAINELYSKAKNEKDTAKKNEYMDQARDVQLNGLNSDYFKKKTESVNINKKEPVKNKAQKLFDAEDKAFEESEKDAQNKYGKMSIDELEKLMQKYSGARKYTPEYNEAMKINDILQQKKEVEFEKKK